MSPGIHVSFMTIIPIMILAPRGQDWRVTDLPLGCQWIGRVVTGAGTLCGCRGIGCSMWDRCAQCGTGRRLRWWLRASCPKRHPWVTFSSPPAPETPGAVLGDWWRGRNRESSPWPGSTPFGRAPVGCLGSGVAPSRQGQRLLGRRQAARWREALSGVPMLAFVFVNPH